jgi:hypothetical protein
LSFDWAKYPKYRPLTKIRHKIKNELKNMMQMRKMDQRVIRRRKRGVPLLEKSQQLQIGSVADFIDRELLVMECQLKEKLKGQNSPLSRM